MAERLISRREFTKAVGLLGVAAVFGSCQARPDLQKQTPEITRSPDITPKPTLSPTTKPTFSPTAKPPPAPTPEITPSPTPESIEKITAGDIVWHGDLKKPYVYLTVDDCWDPKNVETILNSADEAGIKMTFLPVGKVINLNPQLYKEIITSGHAIENHTYNHPRLDKHNKEEIKTEILKARDTLWEAVGKEVNQTFVRPPGGYGVFGYGKSAYKPLLEAATELNYKILMWDITSAGTSKYATANSVEKKVGEDMHNGGISLQHAINVDTKAFPHIVETVLQKGFRPITIPQGME